MSIPDVSELLDGGPKTAGVTRGGGPGRAQRERAVAVLLAELRQAGCRRGIAARLAREHGGGERSWQRAVTEARTLYEHGQDQDDAEAAAPPEQPASCRWAAEQLSRVVDRVTGA
jgi:hypothetical protein